MKYFKYGILIGMALLGSINFSQEPENVPLVEEILDPDIQKVIEGGLKYLSLTQDPEGFWRSDIGYKLNYGYRIVEGKENKPHVGITSLACLAFLANGHLPGQGEYGRCVEKGLDFVLSCTQEKDGFITYEGTRMYSHAFATLFLAEVYGTTYDERVREKLQLAVNLIEKSQNSEGGWRYEPLAQDSDMSITVCQVQALRAARNIGIKISKGTIDKALAYVKAIATQQKKFKYQNLNVSRTSFALTAAGCTALHGIGFYDSTYLRPFLDQLLSMKTPIEQRNIPEGYPDTYFYFYGHYYAAQAMFIEGGMYWEKWYSLISRDLLSKANHFKLNVQDQVYPVVRWRCEGVGDIFGTAMALVILQIPYRYLPIFQK
jgi:hypothetical protein